MNHLLNNENLQASGVIYWNGKSQTKTKLNAGAYIIYLEIFDKAGNVHRLKRPIILK
ncbi:MAG: hypothetical protein LBH12_04785 [Dysgonamonadaceae bacterium]|nr:hypothetical protein [Dysgonamonadaceae bacterium]